MNRTTTTATPHADPRPDGLATMDHSTSEFRPRWATRLVRAEWLKLRTTWLLWAMLPASVALAIAAVTGATLTADDAGVALESSDGVNRALHVTGTGAILVFVLGTIISAGEYRTHSATDTFLTTPRRGRVLAAKLVIGALIGVVVGVLSAAAALTVATLLYEREGATFPADDPEVWSTLGGAVLYAALFALLGVAYGSLLRNLIAAIVSALAWLLVVEQILVTVLPDAARYLPGAAGQAVVRTPDRDLLDPLPAALLLLGYAVVTALASLVTTGRRDA